MSVVYPQNFEQKIEFDKIRQLIANKCLSTLGKEKVDEIRFLSDILTITEKLKQTDEFVHILQEEDAFPANYFMDVRHALGRIRPEGAFLDEKELFDLKRSLQTIADITHFFKKQNDNDEKKYPTLTSLAEDIPVFPKIIAEIDHVLDKYGRIKDNASPELMRIRKAIFTTVGSISRNLQTILRTAQAEGLVDKDISPTMRDGRLVIPVSPMFKRRIKGIVHDESATGKTVFIEPEAVVEANNRIRELENEEKRELMRILIAITDTIRPVVPELLHSFTFLATIDFIRAKALFAIEVNGVCPTIEDKPMIDWTKAIHPLLYLSLKKQEKDVVPLSIVLTDDKRLLIISGPNAGGKSVCLKTVGLLQYMLQCGLLIPIQENSHTGVFDKLLIDIGDEQSIEDDLSTYSSHLNSMKFFIKNCDERTLLLIDEFGSGTDPVIGGALAESILDRFNRNSSFGVITTHYRNLKQYAENHDGVVNGAMLYDRHLMQPLFTLSIGLPGSSFAVDIARKIGLPEDVIAEAAEKVGSDYFDMDKYLQDIVRDKRYWESKRQQIRLQEKKLEDVIARYEKDLETVNLQRKEIVKAAKTEAQHILSEVNAKVENTIREIKEAQAEKERTKTVRQELERFKETIFNSIENDLIVTKKIKKSCERPTHNKQHRKKKDALTPGNEPESGSTIAFKKGDTVRVEGQTANGTVIDIHDKQAIIAFGMLKSAVKIDKLVKVSHSAQKKETKKHSFVSTQTTDAIHKKILQFKHEIDVRGMRGDEALQSVTYFVDDAILANVSPIRILHGTGSGILRQLIRDYLATTPGVRSFKDEQVQFGGTGITVIELE